MILTLFMMFFKKTSDNYSNNDNNNNDMASQELPDLNPDDDIEVIDFN